MLRDLNWIRGFTEVATDYLDGSRVVGYLLQIDWD